MSTMNKLGLHILSGYAGNLGKPRVVKLVDVSVTYKRQVRQQVGPACLIVIRWWLRDQPLNNPVQNARDWYAAHRAEMLAMAAGDPNVIFETGYNEIPREQRAAFAVFLLELMRLMHSDGLRCGVGSWSVGTPELEDWDNEYRPVVDAMQPGDVLSLHEYMADGADVANRYHIGRFLLSPRIKNVPIIITEYGRDVFTENGRTFGFPGWHADPNCSPNQYLGELRAGGAVYDACPNVLGVCVYTAGQITDQKWQNFEVNSLAAIIAAEGGGEYSAGELPPATPPQVVTPPASDALLRHPLPGARVSQRFGENPAYYAPQKGHNGADLAVPNGTDVWRWHGSPVVAAHDGDALIVRDDPSYGLYVYIWGTRCDTLYAHLAEATLPASKRVQAGDLIGWVGYTGKVLPVGVYGTHLHFGYRPKPYRLQNGYRGYEDPLPLLG